MSNDVGLSVRMGDRLALPTMTECKAISEASGCNAIAFYLPSPCQSRGTIQPEKLEKLAAAGYGLLPIYVGSQDPSFGCASDLSTATAGEHARDAAGMMESCGWSPTESWTVALDVEAATYFQRPADCEDYAAAWAAELWRCGYLPTIYGVSSLLAAIVKQLWMPSQCWLASWLGMDAGWPDVATHPAAWAARLWPQGARFWQCWPEGHLRGMPTLFDWSVGDGVLNTLPGIYQSRPIPLPLVGQE